MKKDNIISVIFFLTVFLSCIYYFSQNKTPESINNFYNSSLNISKSVGINSTSQIKDLEKPFYDKKDKMIYIRYPAWSHMPVTYSYNADCIGPLIPRIEQAFSIIEDRTNNNVSFSQENSSADIDFICHKEGNARASLDYSATEHTLGLTTTNIENNLINHTIIEFWSVSNTTYPKSCYSFPRLELHEILHAFGFEHNNNPYSIMYPLEEGCIEGSSIGNGTVTRDGVTFIPEDKLDDDITSQLIQRHYDIQKEA